MKRSNKKAQESVELYECSLDERIYRIRRIVVELADVCAFSALTELDELAMKLYKKYVMRED